MRAQITDTIDKGSGYYETDYYPIGGCFRRAAEPINVTRLETAGSWRTGGVTANCTDWRTEEPINRYQETEPMLKIRSYASLKRSAARSTAWRGHRMRWSIHHGEHRSIVVGVCIRCEMPVSCDTKPQPNGIDIGGEAVALNCTGKR